MDSCSGMISKGGVFATLSGAALLLLSNSSGRDAKVLQSIRRINQLKELAALLESSHQLEPLVVAISGRVASDSPLSCQNSKLQGVIIERTEEQNFLRHNDSGAWVQDTTHLLTTSKEVPWYIEDGSAKVMVVGGRKASGFQLSIASEVFESSDRSLLNNSLDYLQGIKTLGIKKVEKILPVGLNLSVVGEAIRDKDGIMHIKKPSKGPFFVTSSSLNQLISALGAWSKFYKGLSIFCTVFGVYLIASRFYKSFKEKQRISAYKKRVREALTSLEAENNSNPNDTMKTEAPTPEICVICLEQKYNTVFVQCGHMCCCAVCASQLTLCPLCRRHIDQVIRTYRH